MACCYWPLTPHRISPFEGSSKEIVGACQIIIEDLQFEQTNSTNHRDAKCLVPLGIERLLLNFGPCQRPLCRYSALELQSCKSV